MVVSGSRVLDIGSGAGEFATRMNALGADVECVELDGRLRTHLQSLGFTCHESVDEVRGTFDAIVMVNVLEHIEHDSAFLKTLQPLLKDGGRLFVFVPALQFLYSKFDRSIGHFRRYSKSSLHSAVDASGLHLMRFGGFDILGIAPAFAFRLLRQPTSFARLTRNGLGRGSAERRKT